MVNNGNTARKQTALTPNLRKTASSKTIGIPGYRASKCGLPKREPNYTIPKDENNNFFNHVTRSTKGIPAPSHYHKPLSWKTNTGGFGAGPDRKTFTDEAEKQSRRVPAPSDYNIELKRRLLQGQIR